MKCNCDDGLPRNASKIDTIDTCLAFCLQRVRFIRVEGKLPVSIKLFKNNLC